MGFNVSGGKSSSSNQAYDYLKNAYAPQVNTGVQSSNALAGLLGVGGAPAQDQAFQNYLNSAGYKFNLQQGQNAITSSNAASGLLNSGSALKQLQGFGQGLASNYLQQYIANLGGLSNSGLQAGSLVGGAGQTSTSKQSSAGFQF